MIFKSVSQLVDIHDKKVFIELINVYIRLVEVYCERNKVSLNNVTKLNKKLLVSYWIEIGIIKEEADIVMLKKCWDKKNIIDFLFVLSLLWKMQIILVIC